VREKKFGLPKMDSNCLTRILPVNIQVLRKDAKDHTKRGISMPLEEQFNSSYEIASQLRRTIHNQKVKNKILKMGWIALSVLLLYIILDFSVPYIIEFF